MLSILVITNHYEQFVFISDTLKQALPHTTKILLCSPSETALCDAMKNTNQSFDIVFLDYGEEEPHQALLHTAIERNIPIIMIGEKVVEAVKAFEIKALDFILKPISKTRLLSSVVSWLASSQELNPLTQNKLHCVDEQLHSSTDQQENTLSSKDVLVIKETNRIRFLDYKDIQFVRAAGNYIEIQLDDGHKILHRETMKSVEKKLPSKLFTRIHKSTIVKFELIKELRPTKSGDFDVILKTGDTFTLTRTHKSRLPI